MPDRIQRIFCADSQHASGQRYPHWMGFWRRRSVGGTIFRSMGLSRLPQLWQGAQPEMNLPFFSYTIWTQAHTICLNMFEDFGPHDAAGSMSKHWCYPRRGHGHDLTPQALLAGKPMGVDGHAMAHPLKRETRSLQCCKRERSHLCEMVSR